MFIQNNLIHPVSQRFLDWPYEWYLHNKLKVELKYWKQEAKQIQVPSALPFWPAWSYGLNPSEKINQNPYSKNFHFCQSNKNK